MVDQSLREMLSWRLLTETVRRAPLRLRILEMHPGGGQYDCLSLYTVEQEEVAHLNRLGSFTTWATLREKGIGPASADSWDIWSDVHTEVTPVELVDGICSRIGLPVPRKLPSSNAPILVYRFIAELLSWTPCRPQTWECRSGYLDTSGWGGGRRESLFEAFPATQRHLDRRQESDLLGEPAYRFWFILRDGEPVLCLETTGLVWNLNGDSIEIVDEYRKVKRLWPLIFKMADHLLP